MSRSSALVPALVLVLAAVAAPEAAGLSLFAEKRIVVQGRIVSPAGEAMAGWPVHLIGTQRYIELSRLSSGGAVGTVARTSTDANGYYRFDVPRDRHYHFWFLRFVDPAHLDPIKYLPPADLEITSMIRRGRVADVKTTIATHPDWPEVERRVAGEGGEGSERGRILRTLGLPEKTVTTGPREEWWYFTRGIVYLFEGSGPASARRFEPVKPPPARASG